VLDRGYTHFLALRHDEVPRKPPPRSQVNRLIGQLLQGPAVPVRIAERSVQDASEVLYLADLHPAPDELRTRRLYIRNDQV
jgi:hypothetical protein